MTREHDEIDAALFCGDDAIEYIDDGGFTERVVAELPKGPSLRMRAAILLGFTVVAAAVGAVFLPIDALVVGVVTLDLSPLTLAAGASLLVAIGGAAVAAASDA